MDCPLFSNAAQSEIVGNLVAPAFLGGNQGSAPCLESRSDATMQQDKGDEENGKRRGGRRGSKKRSREEEKRG
jgi:hypothetical protein